MLKEFGEIDDLFYNPTKHFCFLKFDFKANAERCKAKLGRWAVPVGTLTLTLNTTHNVADPDSFLRIRILEFFPVRIRSQENKIKISFQRQNFGRNVCLQPKK